MKKKEERGDDRPIQFSYIGHHQGVREKKKKKKGGKRTRTLF